MRGSRLSAIAVLVALGLVAGACGGVVPAAVDPDVDDTFAVPVSTLDGDTYVLRRDNPVLLGTTRLTEPIFEAAPGDGLRVCCDRLVLRASQGVFQPVELSGDPVRGTFVSVQGGEPGGGGRSVETGQDGVVWLWEGPAMLLPADRAEVAVTFSRSSGRDGEGVAASQTIRLRLSPDTLLLPVHVHQFIDPSTTTEQRRSILWEVRAGFDPPGIRVRASSYHDSVVGRIRTEVTSREFRPANRPPDDVWREAGIQFRLASFEFIEHDTLDRDLLTPDEAAQTFYQECTNTRLSRVHDIRSGVPGIHVYVGGRIAPRQLLEQLPGAACGAGSQCREQVDVEDYLMIDHHLYRRAPNTLAHELGHYLGLGHLNSSGSCGRALIGEAADDNLMSSRQFALTEPQIARARVLACDAATRFGVPPATWC